MNQADGPDEQLLLPKEALPACVKPLTSSTEVTLPALCSHTPGREHRFEDSSVLLRVVHCTQGRAAEGTCSRRTLGETRGHGSGQKGYGTLEPCCSRREGVEEKSFIPVMESWLSKWSLLYVLSFYSCEMGRIMYAGQEATVRTGTVITWKQ